ncbi:YkvA family protein [Mycobacterium seoulense]|uniref:YkvA family protein n=1 Tax=Mycobacterium seoulense TaxID=386911 RepID=UPI003CE89E34
MRSDWWTIAIGVLSAFAVIWLILAVAFWLMRPKATMQDLVRLLPDVLRLLKRLAADPELPRRIRIALLALIAFVVSPIDLIPDAIPVIGFADDVIIVGLALRWVSRTAGPARSPSTGPAHPTASPPCASCAGCPIPRWNDLAPPLRRRRPCANLRWWIYCAAPCDTGSGSAR